MSDDLFKDCDCGDCGGCGDCDCDCCDCDCDCDDCLPGNNAIVICCCCMPSSNTTTSDGNRTNRTDTTPGCCCCCENRNNKPRRRKKKGCCCWRIWCCCFLCEDPTPPPSPRRRPGPDDLSRRGYMRDGRYPMPEDLDFYMHSKWSRHHEDDMPPMPPGQMRMHRDEYFGHGGDRWNPRSKESYYKRDRWDGSDLRGKGFRDYRRDDMRKLGLEDFDVRSRRVRGNTRGAAQDVPSSSREPDRKPDNYLPPGSNVLDLSKGDYPRIDDDDDEDDDNHFDRAYHDHRFPSRWSGRQTQH